MVFETNYSEHRLGAQERPDDNRDCLGFDVIAVPCDFPEYVLYWPGIPGEGPDRAELRQDQVERLVEYLQPH